MIQGIVLDAKEKELLIRSMTFFRENFKGYSVSQLDAAYLEVTSPSSIIYATTVELIFMTQSLFKYGKHLSQNGYFSEPSQFRTLAVEMEMIRIGHLHRIREKKENKKQQVREHSLLTLN